MNERHINDIITELKSRVGRVDPVLHPDVPPGMSLIALKEAYSIAASNIGGYSVGDISVALIRINRELEDRVYG